MLQLQKHFAAVNKGYGLFRENDSILLGVSGGPDSVALLSLFIELNRLHTAYSAVSIAHLNHSIRGKESDEDEQFVRDLALQFQLPIIVEKKDIKNIARIQKMSLEEAARDERYNFFEQTAKRIGANVVAVGHNADDNAETILHRIIRGTGIMGASGMMPKRKLTFSSSIDLVRPLLFTWRSDIIAYLKEKGLSYQTDSTNFDKNNFRSKIRMELIPLLEKNYNPGIKSSLIKLGETAGENRDFLKAEANATFEEALLNNEAKSASVAKSVVFDILKLKKAPQIIQQLVIKDAITRLNVPLKKVSYRNYKKLLELLNNQTASVNGKIKDYLNFRIEEGMLSLSKNTYSEDSISVLSEKAIKIPGETELPEIKCRIKTETREIKNGFWEKYMTGQTRYNEAIDLDKIDMPLKIRTRRPGDRFWPLGTQGNKKVKDFFIDSKIPLLERDTIPIVTMNGQPIWIVGFRIDERVRVVQETKKILIMKFEKGLVN